MTDMTQTEPDIRAVDIKGRDVRVKRLRDAQMVLIARDANLLTRDDVTAPRKLAAIGAVMDMFESVIISDADKEYVMQLTRQGELDLSDFMGFIGAFNEDAPVAKKPVVRRGRPRKTT